MTAPLLLYVAYHLPALLLAVWAAASALFADAAPHRGQRAWTLLAAVSLPALVAVLALSAVLHQPQWRPLGVLFPVLALAGAASNVVTVRRAGPLARLMHLPVLGWNATLAGIGAVRCFQDLTGIDAGTAGTALVAGHGLLQLDIGSDLASTRPVWMHLPLLLPIAGGRFHALHWLTLGAAGLIATAMLGVLGARMPAAWDRAEGYRSWIRPASAHDAPVPLALAAPVSERPDSATARDAWRNGLIGVDGAALALHADAVTLGDPERRAALVEAVQFARAAERAVVAIVDLPRDGDAFVDADLFETALGRGAWLAVEHLAPDWVVLPASPRAALVPTTAALNEDARAPVALADSLVRLASETRRARTGVRLAVAIRDASPHGAGLFQDLAGRPEFDAVLLTVAVEDETPSAFRERLAAWRTWLDARYGGARRSPVWFGVAASPHLVGGETGQWHAIRAVLDLARSVGAERVLIEQLVDADAMRGVMAADGRTRLAWRALKRTPPPATPR